MRELVREPIYASEDTRLEWLRREFQRRRVHIAIILGPRPRLHGHRHARGPGRGGRGRDPGRAGPGGDPPVTRNTDGSFEADGRLTLDVAARDLGLTFPPLPPEVETLGGFIVTQLSERAVPGDVVDAAGFRLTVLEVRDRRIRRLRGAEEG